MDIGQPKDFIIGMGLYLSFLHNNFPDKLEQGENFVGSVLVVSERRATCVIDFIPDFFARRFDAINVVGTHVGANHQRRGY